MIYRNQPIEIEVSGDAGVRKIQRYTLTIDIG